MRTSSRNISPNSVDAGDGLAAAGCSMPGRVHRHDQPRDAAVLGRFGVGAHEQLAVVGHVGVRRPDLLAGDHVVVAVAHRPGAQRGEVGAGLGLGEPLAPHVLAAQDRRQVARPLLGRALGDRSSARRAACRRSCSRRTARRPARTPPGRSAPRSASPAPAVLLRASGPRVAGVEQLALPAGVVGPLGRPVVVAPERRQLQEAIGREPRRATCPERTPRLGR